MPNPWTIPLFLDKILGPAIKAVISKTGYGDSIFIVKEFMEKHKDELIEIWNAQGRNGAETWNELHGRWNLNLAEQEGCKEDEEREKLERKKKAYIKLGISEDEAEELVESFPDERPIEVVSKMRKIKKANTNAT